MHILIYTYAYASTYIHTYMYIFICIPVLPKKAKKQYQQTTQQGLHHDMEWLWLVGSIKLSVSFAKEPYKRDYILQKRPMILSILLTVATPYVYVHIYTDVDVCLCIYIYIHIYIYTYIYAYIYLCSPRELWGGYDQ